MAVKHPLQTTQPRRQGSHHRDGGHLMAVAGKPWPLRASLPSSSSDLPPSLSGIQCSTFGFGAQERAGASAQPQAGTTFQVGTRAAWTMTVPRLSPLPPWAIRCVNKLI